MLSNAPPAGGLPQRQRLHRRQMSTPTGFEPGSRAAAHRLPNFPQQSSPQHQQPQQQHQPSRLHHRAPHLSHRRGLSLDTRRPQHQQLSPPTATPRHHEYNHMVSTTPSSTANGIGLPTTPQHPQQQRPACSGSGQQQPSNTAGSRFGTPTHRGHHRHYSEHSIMSENMMAPSPGSSDGFLLSPHGTPQNQHFVDALAQVPDMGGMPFEAMYHMGSINAILRKANQTSFAHNINNALHIASAGVPPEFELYGPDSGMSTPSFFGFPDSASAGWVSDGDSASAASHSRRSSRRISNGIMDKVAKFEAMGVPTMEEIMGQRPTTPPQRSVQSKRGGGQPMQKDGKKAKLKPWEHEEARMMARKLISEPGYFPPTPTDTPHDRMSKHDVEAFKDESRRELDQHFRFPSQHQLQHQQQQQQQQRPSRFSEDYDESMEVTIKPIRGKRPSNRQADIFQDMREEAEGGMPPRANTMPMAFGQHVLGNDYLSMPDVHAEFPKMGHPAYAGVVESNLGPHSAPMAPVMGFPPAADGPLDHEPGLRLGDSYSQVTVKGEDKVGASSRSPSPRRGSPHRHTESLASVTSAASIADLNIEETKTDTGVTIEEIAIYIEGPDPADGKWVCRFEDCGKRFGRRENIKSHVQTHLNDRQYQCPTCAKCFVRQHDLKRHAKIHTGVKPYPCECGNSFARHDALTRHRQRGMCIGAFDGIVRKVVKRGRPRKAPRPDLDERREKSDRTRRKNRANGEGSGKGAGITSASSVSSFSGYSDSSAVNSPTNELDLMMDDDDADQGFPSLAYTGPINSSTMNPSSLADSLAPMPPPALNASNDSNMGIRAGISPQQQQQRRRRRQRQERQEQNVVNAPGRTMAASPEKSATYTHVPDSPPDRAACSSPPATSTGVSTTSRFFDLGDPNSSGGLSESSLISITTLGGANNAPGCNSGNASENVVSSSSGGATPLVSMDDEMLLQFNSDDLVQLGGEHGNMMLATGKFFEDDDAAVGMFSGEPEDADVFFSSS